MKRLLPVFIAGFGLGFLAKVFLTIPQEGYNLFLESIADGSVGTLCSAHDLKFISDANVNKMVEITHKSHIESYQGSRKEANENFKEVMSRSLEYYPECSIKDFQPKAYY